MILEVFQRTNDAKWLAGTWPALEKYYGYWMREPHFTPRTGLSRFHGMVAAPAPEVLHHEVDQQGKNHYDNVREYYRTHPVTEYDLPRYYDAARDTLTPDFYFGDRAVRESGFDLSARFGPFSTDIISHNSVDINVLLYQMELDMAEIAGILGRGWGREGEDRRGLGRLLAADVLEHEPRLAGRAAHVARLRLDGLALGDGDGHAYRPFILEVRSLPCPR